MKKLLLLTLILVTALAISSTAFGQVYSGLIGKYSFNNGTAEDEAGTNDGSAFGASLTTDRFGNAGKAYYFNGTSNYILLPQNAVPNLNMIDAITVSAWIKPDDINSGLRTIVGKWNGNTQADQFLFTQDGNDNFMAIRSVNSAGVNDNSNSLIAGNWHHVVFMYDKFDNNRHKIFVDGVQVYNNTFGGMFTSTVVNTYACIGAQYGDANGTGANIQRYFKGAIDDIQIFNRSLTNAEVQQLFNAPAPYDPNDNGGLISKYSFNYGNTVDEVNTNNAIQSNTTLTTDRFGNSNLARNFNGSTSNMFVYDNPSINLDNLDAFTLSTWIKPSNTTSGLRTIIGKWNNDPSSEQFLLAQSGIHLVIAIKGINNSGTTALANLEPNTWYHIVYTYSKIDNNRQKVYVNNVEVFNSTFGGSYTNTTANTHMSFGAQYGDLNDGSPSLQRFFNGAIDDIHIYNRVITVAQVDSLYAIPNPITTQAQNVTIPDANFKAYLVGNAAINTNGDSEIQVSEAEAFTGQIYIYNLSISDLTGIEVFTSFTNLYCPVNQLTSLDLSHNLSLTQVVCWGNQLTTLNLGNNTVLNRIECENNQLTSLNLNNNTAITMLSCHDNQLSSLKVKNGNNSNITFFRAENNPNLTCIEVDNAAYSTTNWTNIDATASFSEDCSAVETPPVVTIPDANFKAYLVGNAAINTNGDSEIQVSEAEAFTGTINCANSNIANLTGIEAFTALTNLDCSWNQLSSIDLSKNTALLELRVFYNQLTALDITKNVNLTIVSLDINQVSALDVSKNTALIELWCHTNQITNLDVSHNPNLSMLYCQSNQLQSLNVKNGNNINFSVFQADNNPNLTCIEVDDADYSTTNWTNIDATASFSEDCSAVETPPVVTIPDANFKAYLVGNAAINTNGDTEIQVSEAEAFTGEIHCNGLSIMDMTGLEAFTSLSKLKCDQNQLTALDVSKNTLLTDLRCSNNQLTSLNVSENTALMFLYCSTNLLTSLDLTNNIELTILNCQSNQLNTLNLSKNTNLLTLIFSHNKLTSIDLSKNTGLTWVECIDNQLSALEVSNNVALTALQCGKNQLTSLSLVNNTALTLIQCDFNQLTSLNVKNGNNTNFTIFRTNNNPSLACIEVDNASYSDTNWKGAFFVFDAITSFSEDCNLISGINDIPLNNVMIYPNPSTGVFYLIDNHDITITNLTGKIITKKQKTNTIDISDQPTGMYFILLTDKKGQVIQRSKIVKE